jgi:hypothetical protein
MIQDVNWRSMERLWELKYWLVAGGSDDVETGELMRLRSLEYECRHPTVVLLISRKTLVSFCDFATSEM